MSKVTWNPDGERDLLTSREFRRELDRMAFRITAHAIPHSGVDTGRLINSISHSVKIDNGTLVARLGSGQGDGTEAVWYWSWHWAKQAPPVPAPRTAEVRGRKIPHPPRPAPTKPYTKALRELGIPFTIEPGGYES